MKWQKIGVRVPGDVAIVDLGGTMGVSGDDELPAVVGKLLEEGFRKFLLNLGGVPYLDSGGLASVVRAYVTVTRAGGGLRLCNVSDRIREVINVAKLSSTLQVFDSEDSAL